MWFILVLCVISAVPSYSNKKCDEKHERYVTNMKDCQQTCGNRKVNPKPTCAPFTGCACHKGTYRPYDNATGTCIQEKDCPKIPKECGCNEEPTSCVICPPQSCNSASTSYKCLAKECQPGCNCKPGYLRNSKNECILSSDCPPPPHNPCKSKPGGKCCSLPRPTCAVPNPPGCATSYDPKDPCQCAPGFVLSKEGGECIQIESCPDNLGCNSDPNAIIKSCAHPCPSTCDSPNSSLKDCKKQCKLGCECKPGYIRSKENGKCILPNNCPCGNPCNRPNEEFSSCTVSCTPKYCPVDDVKRVTICDFPSPCDSGCVCKFNYRRLNTHNDTCILAEDCPPVKCCRQNEKWFGCRPYCPREFCSEVGKSCSPPIIRKCEPQCNCKDGYFKNNKDVCVAKCDCPCS